MKAAPVCVIMLVLFQCIALWFSCNSMQHELDFTAHGPMDSVYMQACFKIFSRRIRLPHHIQIALPSINFA